MIVSVSFLKNKLGYKQTIDKINKSKADFLHVDIMDKDFVEKESIKYDQAYDLLSDTNKKLDIHLMVKEPINYIKDYINLKPEYITIHIEADNIEESIKLIKENNIKVGLALNPETRIYNILPYMDEIDLVLVMSVHPGAGGQTFIKSSISKINELKAIQPKYNYLVSVDGGINSDVIKDIKSDIVVSGSYICESDDYNKQIDSLKKI